jgi:hypothetical protein
MERGDLLRNLSRFSLAFILLVALLSQVSQAAAQEEGALIVSTLDTGQFPTMKFRLDAYDARGNFIDSLKTGDVQIFEDGQALVPGSLEKIQNGLQVIVAVNLGPEITKRYNGITGYQVIQKALIDWASNRPTKAAGLVADDFSLATPTGLVLIRERDPQSIVKGLTDYQPDLAHPNPALGSLAEALDLATDPLDQAGMKRAVLYITPPLPAANNTTLADLTKRAHGVGVRVNIWEPAAGPGSSPPASARNLPGSIHIRDPEKRNAQPERAGQTGAGQPDLK